MGRSLTFFAYTALLLGGAATIFGPVLGTILFFSGADPDPRVFADAYVPNIVDEHPADRAVRLHLSASR